MADTPTPAPAAGERLRAAIAAHDALSEKYGATWPLNSDIAEALQRGPELSTQDVRDLLALVDKQAGELAIADRAAKIENAKLVELDGRCVSLERELAEANEKLGKLYLAGVDLGVLIGEQNLKDGLS